MGEEKALRARRAVLPPPKNSDGAGGPGQEPRGAMRGKNTVSCKLVGFGAVSDDVIR